MLKRWTKPSRPTESALSQMVGLAYRSVLKREPDPEGLATYAAALRDGRGLAWVLEALARSGEARSIEDKLKAGEQPKAATPVQPAHLLSHGPPMAVDTDCSADELQALWDHVARTWSGLGETEPHWSVLTNEAFRAEALDDGQLAAFYESGNHEVHRLNAWLTRAGLPVRPDAVCAEYGCGVGRITHALARQYGRVIGFDVSEPHLRTARARLAAQGIGNVDLIRVSAKASLQAIRDIDVFYSVIVLQHSPPPIILDVLAQAFRALCPGGYAFFQVPTLATDYRYSVVEHLAQIGKEGAAREMEVHFVPQHVVFRLAHEAGLRAVEVQPDLCTGNLDRWISNTFLFIKD